MSCVILLMRLGCFPSLLLKINDIRQGSSLLFFSYSPICLTNLQNWELDIFCLPSLIARDLLPLARISWRRGWHNEKRL